MRWLVGKLVGSIERMQRGFVKFWVVRPHAGSAPPLLCHHLGKRQIRAKCSSAPPLPGWAPLDPWCTCLGKSSTGQVPGHDATRGADCLAADPRPTAGVKTRLTTDSLTLEAIKCRRCISGDARAACRALVVLAAIGGHVTPQPNHNCAAASCAIVRGNVPHLGRELFSARL